MARVRYLGPEQVTVPELGRTVEPDQIIEVPDDRFEAYVCQVTNWEAVEEPRPQHDEAAPLPLRKTAARPQKEG